MSLLSIEPKASPQGRYASAARRFEIPATVEQVALVVSLFWTLTSNRLFFAAALRDRAFAESATWGFMLALAIMLLALHAALLLMLAAHRRLLKPLLAVMIVATALATHFMERFGVYMDPSMLRNVLRTDVAEARELLSWALVPHLLLYAGLPLAVLSRVRIERRPPMRALLVRALALAGSVALLVAVMLAVFQPLSSLMRNHKELRYLITPANWMWSLASVGASEARGAAKPRQAIGLDAAPGASWAAQTRPRLMVVVVGETARRANWGLSGYARQTNPQLATLPVINFTDVTSCGTNTEVSVPCMFAPVGRRNYDEQRIRGSESLLHVLARAGVAVHWRDNQSGCKGVCDNLRADDISSTNPSSLCDKGHCLDEALLHGLDQRLKEVQGTQLLVLHMLGNHGPAYFRRYPPAFARFKPACESDDLRKCSTAEIVNAYDNALLYTDHVLASLVRLLQAHAGSVDTAMLYVSDHGESLGESGLFLHGMPYPISPAEQKQVPMVMWSSPGFAQAIGLDTTCLRRRATEPASHDYLFHSMLSFLDVRTTLHEPAWDLTAGCRTPRATGS